MFSTALSHIDIFIEKYNSEPFTRKNNTLNKVIYSKRLPSINRFANKIFANLTFSLKKKQIAKKIYLLHAQGIFSLQDSIALADSLKNHSAFHSALALWLVSGSRRDREQQTRYLGLLEKRRYDSLLQMLELEKRHKSQTCSQARSSAEMRSLLIDDKRKIVKEWLKSIENEIPLQVHFEFEAFQKSVLEDQKNPKVRRAARKFFKAFRSHQKKRKLDINSLLLEEAFRQTVNSCNDPRVSLANYLILSKHLRESERELKNICEDLEKIYDEEKKLLDQRTEPSPNFIQMTKTLNDKMKNLEKSYNCLLQNQSTTGLEIFRYENNFLVALHIGNLKRHFRSINDQMNQLIGLTDLELKYEHTVCGCHFGYRGEASLPVIVNSQQEVNVVKEKIALEHTISSLEDELKRIGKDQNEKNAQLQKRIETCQKAVAHLKNQENSGSPLATQDKDVRPLGIIFTCSYGNGHRAAAEAVAQYTGKVGAHVTVLDPSNSFFQRFSPLYWIGKIAKKNWNAAFWFNYTLKKQWYRFQNLQKKLTTSLYKLIGRKWPPGIGRIDPFGAGGPRKLLLRTHILAEMPDFIVTTYHMDFNPIHEIAEELGIPIVHFPTDFDVKAIEIMYDKIPIADPYCKFFLPFISPTIDRTKYPLSDEQCNYTGFPVRPEFLTSFSEDERNHFKANKRIDPDAKIVLIMSGGGGQDLPYAEHLLRSKTWTEKTHIVVVAGKNTKNANKLNRMYEKIKKEKPDITFEIAEDPANQSGESPYFVGPKVIAEWMDVADAVITKSGGVSTAEILCMGTPILFDHRQPLLSWENVNVQEVINAGRGLSCRQMKSFEQSLKKTFELGKDREPCKFPKKNTQQEYVTELNNLLEIARRDPNLIMKREKYLSPERIL